MDLACRHKIYNINKKYKLHVVIMATDVELRELFFMYPPGYFCAFLNGANSRVLIETDLSIKISAKMSQKRRWPSWKLIFASSMRFIDLHVVMSEFCLNSTVDFQSSDRELWLLALMVSIISLLLCIIHFRWLKAVFLLWWSDKKKYHGLFHWFFFFKKTMTSIISNPEVVHAIVHSIVHYRPKLHCCNKPCEQEWISKYQIISWKWPFIIISKFSQAFGLHHLTVWSYLSTTSW